MNSDADGPSSGTDPRRPHVGKSLMPIIDMAARLSETRLLKADGGPKKDWVDLG